MRRAPSESAATPATGDVDRRAGRERGAQALRRLRLDADDAHPVAEPRRLAGGEPAPAGGDDEGVEAVELLLELARHRALPGDGGRMVVRVQHQRAGLDLARLGRQLGVVVVAVDDRHGRAVALDQRGASAPATSTG